MITTPVIFKRMNQQFQEYKIETFRHASVSSTYPCKLVGWSVGWSVTLSDFQSLVSNGRSNQKVEKNKVHLFSNFASGRTLPTHKNVYEGLNALKCI